MAKLSEFERRCLLRDEKVALHRMCSETIDCMAELQTVVSECEEGEFPRGMDAAPETEDQKVRAFYERDNNLRAYQHRVMNAEFRFDASILKLELHLGDRLSDDHRANGYFSIQIARARENLSEVAGPDSSVGVRVLSSNYLIGEGKFPYGPIYDVDANRRFFIGTWHMLQNVMLSITQ